MNTLNPNAETIVHVLARRAADSPDDIAYKFIRDAGDSDRTVALSYRQLYERVTTLSGYLREYGAPGDRVLILYPPGIDYIVVFFACLHAGLVAVPAYPVRNNHHSVRLTNMVRDCAATLMAAPRSDWPKLQASVAVLTGAGVPIRLVSDEEMVPGDVSSAPPTASADDIAFLQYTSGSTGAPKGVMITHANIVHNVGQIQHRFAHTRRSRMVSWLPPYHDMGLISAILEPLYVGFPVTLMSPFDFLQEPYQWLLAVTRERATTTGGPNFAFDLCVDRISDEETRDLDLSSLTVLFNGAEPIRRDTLERFERKFSQAGFQRKMFYPCYGLAEGTLLTLGGYLDETWLCQGDPIPGGAKSDVGGSEHEGKDRISCGFSIDDQAVEIVDPSTRTPLGDGVEGEIWVSGPSVARGYWGKPETNAEVFGAFTNKGMGPFLRTGDLGLRLGREIFVTGRAKDLIIVRGQKYYPQDIERVVEDAVDDIKRSCCVAFEYDVAGTTAVGIVAEIERAARKKETMPVLAAIRAAAMAAFPLPLGAIAVVHPGKTFKTSSGKIQRAFTKRAFLEDGLVLWARWAANNQPATHLQ